MANAASGRSIGCLITYPGSGINYATSGAPSRIRPLFLYGGGEGGTSGYPGTANNPGFSFFDGPTYVSNPSVFGGTKGWLCRLNSYQNANSSNPNYTGGDIGGAIGLPNPASNPVEYLVDHAVYWQGSEAGNCIDTPYINITNPTETDFLNVVAASGTGLAPPYDPNSSDPQASNIRTTYDIWKVELSIGSTNALTSTSDPQNPAYPGGGGQGSVNHCISYWDNFGFLGTAGLVGDTNMLLNAGVSIRLC